MMEFYSELTVYFYSCGMSAATRRPLTLSAASRILSQLRSSW